MESHTHTLDILYSIFQNYKSILRSSFFCLFPVFDLEGSPSRPGSRQPLAARPVANGVSPGTPIYPVLKNTEIPSRESKPEFKPPDATTISMPDVLPTERPVPIPVVANVVSAEPQIEITVEPPEYNHFPDDKPIIDLPPPPAYNSHPEEPVIEAPSIQIIPVEEEKHEKAEVSIEPERTKTTPAAENELEKQLLEQAEPLISRETEDVAEAATEPTVDASPEKDDTNDKVELAITDTQPELDETATEKEDDDEKEPKLEEGMTDEDNVMAGVDPPVIEESETTPSPEVQDLAPAVDQEIAEKPKDPTEITPIPAATVQDPELIPIVGSPESTEPSLTDALPEPVVEPGEVHPNNATPLETNIDLITDTEESKEPDDAAPLEPKIDLIPEPESVVSPLNDDQDLSAPDESEVLPERIENAEEPVDPEIESEPKIDSIEPELGMTVPQEDQALPPPVSSMDLPEIIEIVQEPEPDNESKPEIDDVEPESGISPPQDDQDLSAPDVAAVIPEKVEELKPENQTDPKLDEEKLQPEKVVAPEEDPSHTVPLETNLDDVNELESVSPPEISAVQPSDAEKPEPELESESKGESLEPETKDKEVELEVPELTEEEPVAPLENDIDEPEVSTETPEEQESSEDFTPEISSSIPETKEKEPETGLLKTDDLLPEELSEREPTITNFDEPEISTNAPEKTKTPEETKTETESSPKSDSLEAEVQEVTEKTEDPEEILKQSSPQPEMEDEAESEPEKIEEPVHIEEPISIPQPLIDSVDEPVGMPKMDSLDEPISMPDSPIHPVDEPKMEDKDESVPEKIKEPIHLDEPTSMPDSLELTVDKPVETHNVEPEIEDKDKSAPEKIEEPILVDDPISMPDSLINSVEIPADDSVEMPKADSDQPEVGGKNEGVTGRTEEPIKHDEPSNMQEIPAYSMELPGGERPIQNNSLKPTETPPPPYSTLPRISESDDSSSRSITPTPAGQTEDEAVLLAENAVLAESPMPAEATAPVMPSPHHTPPPMPQTDDASPSNSKPPKAPGPTPSKM